MVEHRVDFSSNKNLIIVAVILVIGIGGASINIGQFTLAGIGLSGIAGVFLNILLPEKLEKSQE